MADDDIGEIAAFPLQETRMLVRDLHKPKPWIYGIDFLVHITLGWAAFITALLMPFLSPVGIAANFIA